MANNFIEAYYEKIWSGKITAGKWIKLWYQYVISGLSEGPASGSSSGMNM